MDAQVTLDDTESNGIVYEWTDQFSLEQFKLIGEIIETSQKLFLELIKK